MAQRVSVSYDSDELEVLIDGTPHLHFWKKYYRGFQAYHELKYTIEIYLKDARMRLEYDDKNLWLTVITHLNEGL